MTCLIPPSLVESVLTYHHADLLYLPLTTVSRLYGQNVYCILKINLLVVADNLKVSKDKMVSQSDLYSRVVDLHFSRGDRVLPSLFCYELAEAIGRHQSEKQQALFAQSIFSRYPGLQQAANQLTGLFAPLQSEDQHSIIKQNLLINVENYETFAT